MSMTSIQLPFWLSWEPCPDSKSSDFVADILQKSRIPMHPFFVPKMVPKYVPRRPPRAQKAVREQPGDPQDASKCFNKNEPRKKTPGPSKGGRGQPPRRPGRCSVIYIYIYIYIRMVSYKTMSFYGTAFMQYLNTQTMEKTRIPLDMP